MFENVKDFFGRMRKGMFDTKLVSGTLGQSLMSDEMSIAMNCWKEMYEEKEGLRLPAAIAFEMARLVTVEMDSGIMGGARGYFLNDCYREVIDKIRIPLEYGCAKGGLVLKPYVSDGRLKVDFIQADKFIPTAFDEMGNIMGAVFIQRIKEEGQFYTRLESHRLSGRNYEISNKVFLSRNQGSLGKAVSLEDVDAWKTLSENVTIENVEKPLFGYFKPAIANTIDSSSPIGVSVFANAVNLIEDANRQYERLLWEFESGERALIANTMAFKRDKDGRPCLPDRKLYRTLDVEDIDFFKEWSPQLRGSEIAKGLNRILRQIEFNCGLAYGTLSEVSDTQKTAEEIRVSKQRSFSTVSDNQKALRKALCDMVYAMDVWCTLCDLAPKGKYEIYFDFDDSIIADRELQFEERKSLVEKGIMEPWEFRMWYFGEEEDVAKKKAIGDKDLSGMTIN